MSQFSSWFLGIACIAATWGLTWVVRHHALHNGVLDVPNQRSSHSVPTPSGGGVAMVITICLGVVYLWSASLIDAALSVALVGCGGIVAAVGYLDDRFGLGVAVRFGTHVAAAAAAVLLLEPQALAAASLPALPTGIGLFLLILGICWWLNLFNFMDGIDGIAATEAGFITGSAAVLTTWSNGPGAQVTLQLLVAAASLGFLLWNWAPARIFMGDVGSGFLGYVLALLALASSLDQGTVSIWTWLVLGSLFVADATVTLLRRILRGERFYAAHCSHAYQVLSRRWQSHSRVTALYLALNVLIVLPLAWWSVMRPEAALPIALATLLVAGVAAALTGAGRAERADDRTSCAYHDASP